MSDIKDILTQSGVNLNVVKKQKAKKSKGKSGLPRELAQIMDTWENENKQMTTIVPSAIVKDEFKAKRQATAPQPVQKAHWRLDPIKSSARLDSTGKSQDDVHLFHWMKSDSQDYKFARYNKKIKFLQYTSDEYDEYLQDPNWTREMTDFLFALCEQFDLRFFVIFDRWQVLTSSFDRYLPSFDEAKKSYVKPKGSKGDDDEDDDDVETPNLPIQPHYQTPDDAINVNFPDLSPPQSLGPPAQIPKRIKRESMTDEQSSSLLEPPSSFFRTVVKTQVKKPKKDNEYDQDTDSSSDDDDDAKKSKSNKGGKGTKGRGSQKSKTTTSVVVSTTRKGLTKKQALKELLNLEPTGRVNTSRAVWSKTMEQLKDRFYTIQRKLLGLRSMSDSELAKHPQIANIYDGIYETDRKEQLQKMYNRGLKPLDEEDGDSSKQSKKMTDEDIDAKLADLALELRSVQQQIAKIKKGEKDKKLYELQRKKDAIAHQQQLAMKANFGVNYYDYQLHLTKQQQQQQANKKKHKQEEKSLLQQANIAPGTEMAPIPSDCNPQNILPEYPTSYVRSFQIVNAPVQTAQFSSTQLEKLERELQSLGLRNKPIAPPTGAVSDLYDELRREVALLLNLQKKVAERENYRESIRAKGAAQSLIAQFQQGQQQQQQQSQQPQQQMQPQMTQQPSYPPYPYSS